MKTFLTYLFFLLFTISLFAQKILKNELKSYRNPAELVTLSSEIPFNKAIDVLSRISEKELGKKIVLNANIKAPIGLKINNMYFLKALDIIVKFHNLKYTEKKDVIVVEERNEPYKKLSPKIYAPISEREVKISAIFFEANITKMKERGLNWDWLLSSSGLKIGGKFNSFIPGQQNSSSGTSGNTKQQSLDFNLNSQTVFNIGKIAGNASAVFKFFEDENLGTVIAKPSITVRDRTKGRIQIGSDISIKQRDFSGNLIDKFFSTGTIINVTPYIYTQDGINYILLKLNVEKSSIGVMSVLTTEIKKTQAQTEVLMLNGEETVIGGLYVNEVTSTRRGIPILKDLPWWVFGIRYLTGYTQKQVVKKEIVISIRVNILPTLKSRMKLEDKENLIRKRILEDQKDVNRLMKNHTFNKGNN